MWPNMALKPAIRLRACPASQHNYQHNISPGDAAPRGTPHTHHQGVRDTKAEAVAFVVCQAVGLEIGNASQDYVTVKFM
jgi:hypothetical protein